MKVSAGLFAVLAAGLCFSAASDTPKDSPKEPPAAKAAAVKQKRDALRSLELDVSADFDQTPLSQVIAFFSQMTGTTIHFDEVGLQDAMVVKDAPVSLKAPGLTLGVALDLVLKPMNLDYYVVGDMLVVSSVNGAAKELATKVYPAADLVELAVANRAKYEPGVKAVAPKDGGPGSAGGGLDLIEHENPPAVASVLRVIRDGVAFEKYEEMAPEHKLRFDYASRSLVVRGCWKVHRATADLLKQLRAAAEQQ
ncbi:MAG TPA: hypothetical protein VNC50_09240 [Planctomycetia bacterium]|nr:hypothetical protein [Planctomycetia bacterium]